ARPVVVDNRSDLATRERAEPLNLVPLLPGQQFLAGVEVSGQQPWLQRRAPRRWQRGRDRAHRILSVLSGAQVQKSRRERGRSTPCAARSVADMAISSLCWLRDLRNARGWEAAAS